MAANDLMLIVCAAPLAARTADLVTHLADAGWRPTVVATPDAVDWLDTAAITRVTGRGPRHTFRAPTESKGVEPAAVAVCPLTFNSLNKAAAGIADTYAMAALCEALGAGLPTVLVPMINDKLWRHPACGRSLTTLQDAGAGLVDVRTGRGPAGAVPSGTGDDVVARFDPAWLSAALPAPA